MWFQETFINLLYNQTAIKSRLYFFALLCFLPYVMHLQSFIEDTPLRGALDTDNSLYRGSCIAQLALLLPIISDLLLDFFMAKSKDAQTTKWQEGIFSAKSSRINIVIGCCLISLPSLISRGTDGLAMMYLCCRRSSQMLLNWEYFHSLMRLDPNNWPYDQFLVFSIILEAGEILNVFGVNTMAEHSGNIPPLFILSLICLYTPVAVATFYVIRLLMLGRLLAEPVHQTSFSVSKLPTPETTRHVEQEQRNKYNREYLFLHKAYVAIILGVSGLLVTIAVVYWRVYDMDDLGLFLHNITVIIYELTTIAFATQNLRFEVYFAMVRTHK
jgi:hypothetical protein